jgi:hypothetical protein
MGEAPLVQAGHGRSITAEQRQRKETTMKYLISALLALSISEAHAFDCPKALENYSEEIAALRSQQKPLSEQLNTSTDTATAIILANKSIELEERISGVLQRMYECDAIGRLNKNN